MGAEPVFVDVDPKTWCIDPAKIEAAVTPRTRGIIPVHLYGHPADMDQINHLAGVHGLWVVEDAAEAHLARYKGRPTGGLAPIATFSFYGNKIFTCGEGGCVTLSDPQLELRIRTLRGQGMDPERRYYFPVTGYNFRMTNVQAAMLCAQLERHETILGQRRRLFAAYQERLASIAGIGFQPRASWAEPAPWLFSIVIDEKAYGRTRDELAALLGRTASRHVPSSCPCTTCRPSEEAPRHAERTCPRPISWRNVASTCPPTTPSPSRTLTTSPTASTPMHGAAVADQNLEFRVLRPELLAGLTELFTAFAEGQDHAFFHPHPMTAEVAARICRYDGRDLYYAACAGDKVLAYGILRGWEEGFDIPSLGIAIHPEARGRGLARPFMVFLHAAAKLRGATKVRLTVYNANVRAAELYRRMGYRFEPKNDRELIGILEL